MASPQSVPGHELEIRRTFTAPRERVFQAWTTPEALTAWFCHARPAYTGKVDELDLRVGGSYALQVHDTSSGQEFYLRGKYVEIDPPETLAFTWAWDGHAEWGESIVRLEFKEQGNSTEMVMRHGGFPTAQARDAHSNGWVPCFESLAGYLKVEHA